MALTRDRVGIEPICGGERLPDPNALELLVLVAGILDRIDTRSGANRFQFGMTPAEQGANNSDARALHPAHAPHSGEALHSGTRAQGAS